MAKSRSNVAYLRTRQLAFSEEKEAGDVDAIKNRQTEASERNEQICAEYYDGTWLCGGPSSVYLVPIVGGKNKNRPYVLARYGDPTLGVPPALRLGLLSFLGITNTDERFQCLEARR